MAKLKLTDDDLRRLFMWGEAYQADCITKAEATDNPDVDRLHMILADEQRELLTKIADAAGIL